MQEWQSRAESVHSKLSGDVDQVVRDNRRTAEKWFEDEEGPPPPVAGAASFVLPCLIPADTARAQGPPPSWSDDEGDEDAPRESASTSRPDAAADAIIREAEARAKEQADRILQHAQERATAEAERIVRYGARPEARLNDFCELAAFVVGTRLTISTSLFETA